MIKRIVLALLKFEATLVLRRHKPEIIGITGSVGKTSAKEAAGTLLAEHFRTGKSPKSYNSSVGIPLAILGLESAWHSPSGWLSNLMHGAWRVISPRPYPQILVLEMGVDRPGDFDVLLSFVRPTIGVETAIGSVPAHVEFFESKEALALEKSKLVVNLPRDGWAILNADDELTLLMGERTHAKVLTYGFSKESNVKASGYRLLVTKGKPRGITFKVEHNGESVVLKIEGVIGKQNAYALLAAAAVGVAKGLTLTQIAEGLLKVKPSHGRLNLIEGINNTLIIDDTYNSSPMAVAAGLEILSSITAKRKIAVLGDMLELGKYTTDEHRRIGTLAGNIADMVIAVGIRSKFMDTGAAKVFHWFPTSHEAAAFLKANMQEDDVYFVKGSQGVRMERVVAELMAEPERAHELLVRQEAYWKDKK